MNSRLLSRALLHALACTSLAAASAASAHEDPRLDTLHKEVIAKHDANVQALRDWIALPSIAAENRNYPQGAEYMAKLLTEAGFQHVEIITTDGKPGVFATLDAGAPKTVGMYLMYDVKQYDPSEWTSPPLEGRIVDKPGIGKVMVGRGAVNQKGPEMAFLAAMRAFEATNTKLPVNIALIAEGEEEIGSSHIVQITHAPQVQAALAKTVGVFMPSVMQDLDGSVQVALGAKGIVELELVASGEKWGRGPTKDIHSSLKAMVDSPAWRLVKALDTLVSDDGNTITVDNYPKPAPLSPGFKKMIDEGSPDSSEQMMKDSFGVKHWIDDLPYAKAQERLESQPTINIEGLVAGYTGPGGKTVLPHRAVAKIDMRLVPGMTFDAAVAALKAHLAKRGYGDIEVNVTGGYNPTQSQASAPLIQAQLAVARSHGIQPSLWPRSAGSYPGFAFTDPPLSLPSGHFGLGYGTGAHAPDEYFVIDSTNKNLDGFDGAAMSYAEYFYELAK
jgi:acetylornithine deacetylase/succinyl-diaminopimelate desuccinylase-like protein